MRTASILLVLVVVLGFVREAGAFDRHPTIDYTFCIGSERFGFMEWIERVTFDRYCVVFVGPLGARQVPFTAIQGLIGSCLIVLTLIVLLATFTVRWKRKRRTT
jgi:hypothetical protein